MNFLNLTVHPEYIENYDIYKIIGQTFSLQVLDKGKNFLLLSWDSKNKILYNYFFHQFKIKKKLKLAIQILQTNEHPIFSSQIDVIYLTEDKKAQKEYSKRANLVISELKTWLGYYIGDSITYKQEKD